jgi:hypothetical protein
MSKDILSETFQKHLKLLHKHLNINEAYGDAAHLDFVSRDRGVRPDWDPDGLTGIRQSSPYTSPKTIDDFAKEVGWDDSMIGSYIGWLNSASGFGGNGWSRYSPYNGTATDYKFHDWKKEDDEKWNEKQKERDAYQTKREKEKQEAPSREIESKAFEITRAMTMIIQSIGLVKWQVFKLKNPESKLKYLSDYFEKNKDKLTKGHFDREKYEDIKPYFDKYSNNDQQAKLILLAAIKKSEKSSGGRGFFEQ